MRSAAVIALASTDLSPDRLVAMIADAIVDQDMEVRGAGVIALQKLGDASDRAIPVLITLLRSDDPHTRSSAAFALGSMGVRAESATDELIEAMKHEADVNSEIAIAISRIGPAAVPALLRASADPEHAPAKLAVALAESVQPRPSRWSAQSNRNRFTLASARAGAGRNAADSRVSH